MTMHRCLILILSILALTAASCRKHATSTANVPVAVSFKANGAPVSWNYTYRGGFFSSVGLYSGAQVNEPQSDTYSMLLHLSVIPGATNPTYQFSLPGTSIVTTDSVLSLRMYTYIYNPQSSRPLDTVTFTTDAETINSQPYTLVSDTVIITQLDTPALAGQYLSGSFTATFVSVSTSGSDTVRLTNGSFTNGLIAPGATRM